MLEDYYKILSIKHGAGIIRIARNYLKFANKYYSLIQTNKEYEISFYETNRAVEVLKDEGVRKFYDILLKKQSNNTLDMENPTIKKYFTIVKTKITVGNSIAEKLLNNNEYLVESGIIQTDKAFWIKFLTFINPNLLFKYGNMPVLSLTYIVVGLAITTYNLFFYNKEYLIVGTIISLFSAIMLLVNFQCYILVKVNKLTFPNK